MIEMPFIQFPFIEVPKEIFPVVGEPTPGTRAYRREGTYKECGEWFEFLAEYYKGDVGLSTGGVIMFVPVSRAGVHKRIMAGKLTAFFFYVTHEETRLFGAKRKAKERPFILVSVSECKAWAEQMKRKVGFVDDPNETPFLASTRLLREDLASRRLLPDGGDDEPTSAKEEKEADEFANKDPKDKSNRRVKYRDYGGNKELKQQDWLYMQEEIHVAMTSPEKAAALRRRLRKGMEWDKENKTWRLKEEK
ncbi:MAG TPA: hypothetical protein VME24_00885 [Alphaproteobacteria bacterium]|nr:hypothetical protein [Alphaproteobacteria bacterium]